jgi:mono/diheme cytochrome c family protein
MNPIWATLLAFAAVAAHAQSSPAAGRGELLYTTHCRACHTTQVHWRERKLATDWASLAAQVERWQTNAGLGWSGEDVDAVARYLNARFYHFPETRPVGARPDAPRS